MNNDQALVEFDKQVHVLLDKGYVDMAKLPEESFLSLLESLRACFADLPQKNVDIENGYIPFVIVVSRELVSTELAMSKVVREGKNGITKLFPHNSTDFHTIPDVRVPEGGIYLLLDINRGGETINMPPIEAFKMIQKENRSPLTIDEGVAIVTQYPEFLMKNNCFSLLASRNPKDKRVPAIWINAAKEPNLGWCWDGNPHTWLGSASCTGRLAGS